MELDFSPSILDTSLSTPNLTNNDQLIFKSSYANEEKPLIETMSNESLSKIKYDLKQSFTHVRQPTESPFQKIIEAGVLPVDKHVTIPSTTDDVILTDIPSTAEVMNVIESFSKNLVRDKIERESTIISDNIPIDSVAQMGVIVSPKKKLLYRSQSQTDDIITDEQQQQFQRLNDIPLIESMPTVIIATSKTGKRQHEVTSSSSTTKRQKIISINENSNDQRKQQIRDSNREAARRCRERRRQYIEQLEGNLEQYKAQIKQLNEKIVRAERENTQLRTILTETKLFHITRETTTDFPAIISTTD